MKRIPSFIFVLHMLFLHTSNNSHTDPILNEHPTLNQLLAKHQERLAEQELANFSIEHAPEQIRDVVFCLQNPHLCPSPTTLLLVGAPGVGKTTLATAIAYACNRPYHLIKCSMIGDKYQNSGPEHLKEHIEPLMASEQPCVIIADEINMLFEKFNDELSPDKKTAAAFWQYLDTVQKRRHILFIGTANDMSHMPAPLRDRFEGNIVEISMPDDTYKKKIIDFHLKKYCHEPILAEELLYNTKDFSPRKIEQLIDRMQRKSAIRTKQERSPLTVEDLHNALKDFEYTRSWTLWLETHQKTIEKCTHTTLAVITVTISLANFYLSWSRGSSALSTITSNT